MTDPIAARDCYALLQQPALYLLDHCRQLAANPEAFWPPHFCFQAMALSRDWISREPALVAIEAICSIAEIGILRMPYHWVYDWNRDQNRQTRALTAPTFTAWSPHGDQSGCGPPPVFARIRRAGVLWQAA